jgi:hypothetical protein
MSHFHRIGWWENLQESPIIDGKNHGFRLRFSLKPIHWRWHLRLASFHHVGASKTSDSMDSCPSEERCAVWGAPRTTGHSTWATRVIYHHIIIIFSSYSIIIIIIIIIMIIIIITYINIYIQHKLRHHMLYHWYCIILFISHFLW